MYVQTRRRRVPDRWLPAMTVSLARLPWPVGSGSEIAPIHDGADLIKRSVRSELAPLRGARRLFRSYAPLSLTFLSGVGRASILGIWVACKAETESGHASSETFLQIPSDISLRDALFAGRVRRTTKSSSEYRT
jgi:hypothetical protein